LVVFTALTVINFLASKAFPVQYAQPDIVFDGESPLIFPEEEFDEN